MKTGYFAQMAKYDPELKPVSIALYTPKAIKIRQCMQLCPPPDLLARYKTGVTSKEQYVEEFNAQLAKLDAQELYDWLGENAILLCYEKAGDFCHRRLVAEWLETNLGIKIPEAKTR
jgi:hypothetical protein